MPIDRVDEAFLLLALRPDGRFPDEGDVDLDHGLAGAWLAELLVDGRLRLQDGRLRTRGASPMDDPALDWVLERIRQRRRARPPSYWVAKLGRRAQQHRPTILQRLEGRGAIERRGEGWSGEVYPLRTPEMRERILQHLKEGLSGKSDDEAVLALLAVLDGAGLLEHVFGRGQGVAYHNAIAGRLQRDHRLLNLARSIRHPHVWWLPWGRA